MEIKQVKTSDKMLEYLILFIYPFSYVFFSDVTFGVIDDECRKNKYFRKVFMLSDINHIGKYAFSGCKNLEEIYIPDTVNYLGEHAFNGCEKLKKIRLSTNINQIERSVFYDCYNLQKLFLSNQIKNIKRYAFCNCSSLILDIEDRRGKIIMEADATIGCNSLDIDRSKIEYKFSRYDYPSFVIM